jgi:predicted metal-dependent peptidase
MNSPPDIYAEAGGMLRIALRRMASAYPFHANLLSAGRFEVDGEVSTVGVTVQHGVIKLLYDPKFVVACSFNELTGVLHHEINHVLFGHIFNDPAAFPDEEARIIAEEVTANEFVREPLPGQPITLSQYPQLPPLEDTHTRYRRLVQTGRNPGGKGPKKGPKGPEMDPGDPKNGHRSSENMASIQPLDDHDVWEQARQNSALSKMAVGVAARKARRQLSADQWTALRKELQHQIGRLDAGDIAGKDVEELADGATGVLNWQQELRRFVGRVLEIRPVFNRPPRRFPELVGIIPGRGRRCGKPRILAVIDTSASLSGEMLACICQELSRLARTNDVLVVECDAAIQAVYPYRGPIKNVRGRGGTDLRCVFAADFLKKNRPDVIIYFTDGDGPAPLRPPKIPVIWCLTPDGETPATWGHVVRLENGCQS